MDNPDFEIDDELLHYMPRTSEVCDEVLEKSLQETNGPREPLLVWDEANVLLDGHRRWKICRKLGLPFLVKRISCKDRDDAKRQMDEIQIVRRNLSDHDQAIMEKRVFDRLKASGMTTGEAIKEIAKQDSVTERAVFNRVDYGGAFESLSEEWQQIIKNIGVPQKYVSLIAQASGKSRRVLLRSVKSKGIIALRERFDTKVIAPVVPDPNPAFVNPIDPESEVDEVIKNKHKTNRVLVLLEQAEKAAGASTRACYKLFGEQGLDASHSYWKRRIDKAHRELAQVLKEVRQKHG